MKVNVINTIEMYEELLTLPEAKRSDYFRNTMMQPFSKMWEMLNVPLRARATGGYDVLMAVKMLGWADFLDTSAIQYALAHFSEQELLKQSEAVMNHCIAKMTKYHLKLSVDELTLGIFVADEIELALSEGYTGFGGIPGFITLAIYPNTYNMRRLPALIAHEFHHNIRFSYFNWDHGNVTVGEYLVIEGLAESFAQELYGKDYIGPWVTKMEPDDLDYSIYVIGEALDVKGFVEVSSYMFGEEIAKKQGYAPVGLSYCAGYAVGYAVVQAYLRNAKQTIYEATLVSAHDIIKGSGLFK